MTVVDGGTFENILDYNLREKCQKKIFLIGYCNDEIINTKTSFAYVTCLQVVLFTL